MLPLEHFLIVIVGA